MELRTEDVTLSYEDEGDPDGPPVLLLHGITSSAATWAWIVPHLAPDHRVVRLDLRGHGRSGRTPGAYAFPDYVADATAVAEEVLGRPAVVVGHSLGGGTAAALAQTRPDLVGGVVLEDPAIMAAPAAPPDRSDSDSGGGGGGAGRGAALEGNGLLAGFRVMRRSIPRLQGAGLSVADVAGMLHRAPGPSGPTFGESLLPDAIEAMAEAMLQVDVTVLDPVFDGSHAPVFDPERELPVPGIVLAGDPALPDTLVRRRDIERLAARSPQVEVRVLAGVGHLIHDAPDHRATVLQAVRDVLGRS